MSQRPTTWAYVNGHYVPLQQASLPVYDAGFVYGATVSDVLRTYRGQWYRFEHHAERFLRSCQYVGIELPLSCEELRKIAEELKARSSGEELGLVMLATPGLVALYAGLAADEARQAGPTVVLHAFTLRRGQFRTTYERGLHLIVAANRQVPPDCWDPKAKCRSRLHWWLALRQVRGLDAEAVPLLLDHNGNLTESAAANVLLVRDGVVFSPPPERILWGISLQSVRELCAELGLPFECTPLQMYHAVTADEILLTNSLFAVAPVTRFNGRHVRSGRPGPVFRALYDAWSARIGTPLADA